jgi:hypothetical protein
MESFDDDPNFDLLIELAQKKSWYQVKLWRQIWIFQVVGSQEFSSPNGSVIYALDGDLVCRTWNMYYSIVDSEYLLRSYYQTRMTDNGWIKFLPRHDRSYWAAQIFRNFVFVNVDGEDQFGKRGDYLVMDNDEDLFLIPKRFFHKEYQKMLTSSDIQAVTVAFGIVSPVIRGLDISNPGFKNVKGTPLKVNTNERQQQQKVVKQQIDTRTETRTETKKETPQKIISSQDITSVADTLQIINTNVENTQMEESSDEIVQQPEPEQKRTSPLSPGIIGGLTPSRAKVPNLTQDDENVPITDLYSRNRLRSHQDNHPNQKVKTGEDDDVPEFIKVQRQIRNSTN